MISISRSRSERKAAGSQTYQDVGRHITVESLRELGGNNLVKFLQQKVAASSRFRDQALVYIHGCDMTFANALVRMGQIVAVSTQPGQDQVSSSRLPGTVLLLTHSAGLQRDYCGVIVMVSTSA